MLYVSNRHFCFFAKQNIKFCFRVKDSVWIGYSNILTKLAANPFCFKKQALELRTVDSIFQKLSALQTVFKIFFFLILKSIQTWKNCCKDIRPSPKICRSKVSSVSSTEMQLLYPYSRDNLPDKFWIENFKLSIKISQIILAML